MTEKKAEKKASIFDILRSRSKARQPATPPPEEKSAVLEIVKAEPAAIRQISDILEDSRRSEHDTPSEEALQAEEPADPASPGDGDDAAEPNYESGFREFPVIHFDAMDGVISYLERREVDVAIECSKCGALIALDVDRCPLCGAPLRAPGNGLLNLIRDSDIDSESLSELECPQCGEHVVLREGRCPSCESQIVDEVLDVAERKIVPLIRAGDIVFVHIDLETGDLNYLQRHLNRMVVEHMSLQQDDMTNTDTNGDQNNATKT